MTADYIWNFCRNTFVIALDVFRDKDHADNGGELEYITKPEEVMSMFSEALKIMDSNTVKYMMDELSDELSDELADTKSRLAVTIIEMTKEYSGTKEQAKDKLIKECGKQSKKQ